MPCRRFEKKTYTKGKARLQLSPSSTVYSNDMFNSDSLKQKYNSLIKDINFKDFFGFSALMFGLLLSNTSAKNVDPLSTAKVAPVEAKASKQKKITPKPLRSKSQKKLSLKKQKKRLKKTAKKSG